MIKAVLFDWGDTVMEELPGMSGPMAEWKQVAATPGIRELLAELHGRVEICLATNAGESDQVKVRKALARVGLDEYFGRIYTARDLHSMKPQAAFFQTIMNDLGLTAEECLMVGNSISSDANGAAEAGLHSIWLMRDIESMRAHPLFDCVLMEYGQFNKCFQKIESKQLPNFKICLKLLKDAGVHPGLFRHVQKVALTGYVLALRLLINGMEIDPIHVHRAGLLHDIDKPSLDEKHQIHGQLGGKMVQDAGYGVLSEAVRNHQVLSIMDEETLQAGWEAKLVYMADKLVEKDRLVGADARMDHLITRYAEPSGALERSKSFVLNLEKEIAGLAGLKQENLLDYLHKAVDGVDIESIRL